LIFKGFFIFSRGKYPNRTPTAVLYLLECTIFLDFVREESFFLLIVRTCGAFAPGELFVT
jgi:hypothetical protein